MTNWLFAAVGQSSNRKKNKTKNRAKKSDMRGVRIKILPTCLQKKLNQNCHMQDYKCHKNLINLCNLKM